MQSPTVGLSKNMDNWVCVHIGAFLYKAISTIVQSDSLLLASIYPWKWLDSVSRRFFHLLLIACRQ